MDAVEVELKFQVPPAQRARVARALATPRAVTLRLRAVYADTPDRRLAQAGLALRLRQEGRRWVQTLKAPGDGLLQRLEHEVVVAAPRGGSPVLDINRHAGTPAGDALAAALGPDGAQTLRPLYRTDVRRTLRQVRHGGALVEVAHDRGWLLAAEGSPAAGARALVDELEFELLRGDPAALVSLAARWAARHGLWWDPRTKSERGYRLALGVEAVPALRARRSSLDPQARPAQALAGMLRQTLAQALPNAAEIADGRGTPDHLHQLRVALRRLRSVLRLFGDWSSQPEEAAQLQADWREPFAQLGQARDRDVLAQTLRPALAAAGAPPFAWPATAQPAAAPADLLRGPVFGRLVLRSLALSLAPEPPDQPALGPAAAAVMQAAWKPLLREAPAFSQAPVAAQHRARRRLKRLRYALELLLPLYKGRSAKPLQRALAAAADALGALNDLYVAEDLLRPLAADQPSAWFAVGWVVARREAALAQAQAALQALSRLRRPWKR